MTRKFKFEQNRYFHICNRSNDQSPIFLDERDYARFLFFILYYQTPIPFFNISRNISYFVKHSMSDFNISHEITERTLLLRNVELASFAIMPNHFHLFLREKTDDGIGIPRYLQRVQTGYAKYFNAKYKKRGHLFQGSFRAVPVRTSEQLLYLSAYIHRNPRELHEWKNREIQYPWSSYQDHRKKNRWGELLKTEVVLNNFSSGDSYFTFVETSTAKLQPGESPIDELKLE